MDLDGYSRRAEAFSSQLVGEYHRLYAGLQPELEVGAVYARHADLFAPEAIEQLGDARGVGADDRHERRRRALLRFAVEGHITVATAPIEAELGRRTSELSLRVRLPSHAPAGARREFGFHEAAVALAEEADGEIRAALDQARREAMREVVNPLAEQVLAHRHDCARELGWRSYGALYGELMGVDLGELAAEAEAFLQATDASYGAVVEPALLDTLGHGLDGLRRSDVPRFLRQPEADRRFPPQHLVGSLRATLAGLGIDLDAQDNITLDIEARQRKSTRAFCAAVRVPQEIHLVVPRVGGRADYVALMHEAGHAEHFAAADPELPFELRRLGDPAIGEAFAFLLDGLVSQPQWLQMQLGIRDQDGALRRHTLARRLMLWRRHAAKLGYEIELHGGLAARPPGEAGEAGEARAPRAVGASGSLADVYAQRVGRALCVEWPPEAWLIDVDPGLYAANYLRAWALEAHLARALRERFGAAWFARAVAGRFLLTLWHEAQGLSAEELLELFAPGERLNFADLADEFATA